MLICSPIEKHARSIKTWIFSKTVGMLALVFFLPLGSPAQSQTEETIESGTLNSIIDYALAHQPEVQQAKIDEEITERILRGRLADWYPQLNFAYNYQRFLELQASVIGGNVIRFGVNNTSSAQFTASQTVFNRDVLLASSTASLVRSQAALNTSRSRIDVVVDVSKAFYDVLATLQQINVSEESVDRLEKSRKDAYSRYTAGISDKTDYKRATILLGNAQAALTSNREQLKFKEQQLKMLMGFPPDQELSLVYEVEQLESEILLDTAQELNYAGHIDYRVLQSQKELQEANVKYSRWAFLPSVNLFGAYNLNYQNNNFSELYDTRYPFSFVGATVALPLLQGGKRLANAQQASLSNRRIDVGLINLQNLISAEYSRALASYKGNLAAYKVQQENVELAEEVYDIIELQYQNGVKTYLDVTIAESDLRTTRINYYNALYAVMASKMDVLRALGQINY